MQGERKQAGGLKQKVLSKKSLKKYRIETELGKPFLYVIDFDQGFRHLP
jgi:hypothetical protein